MFNVWSSFIQKFGEKWSPTQHQQHELGKSAALRDIASLAHRTSLAACRWPRRPRPRLPRPSPPEARTARATRTPTPHCPRHIESAPATPPYVRRPSPVARPGASRVVIHHDPVLERLLKPLLAPPARQPEPLRRHCRRRPELVLPLVLAADQMLQ
jgi:hypothetical protein